MNRGGRLGHQILILSLPVGALVEWCTDFEVHPGHHQMAASPGRANSPHSAFQFDEMWSKRERERESHWDSKSSFMSADPQIQDVEWQPDEIFVSSEGGTVGNASWKMALCACPEALQIGSGTSGAAKLWKFAFGGTTRAVHRLQEGDRIREKYFWGMTSLYWMKIGLHVIRK